MKKTIIHLCCFSLLCLNVLSVGAATSSIAVKTPTVASTTTVKHAPTKAELMASLPVADLPALPKIHAKAYVLMDAASGYVIAEHNADEQYPPASLTKMMTSYIISEKIAHGELKLSERVGITREASAGQFPGASRIWLKAGQKVSVDDLHRGLVIASGNDAAVALAQHLAHSVEGFVELMNQKADSLGMLNTRFKNPHGLPAEGHFSSAKDMALLARAIVWDYPEDYFLYREKSYTLNGVTQSNRNTLLWDNPFVDGIKTGYTKAAGYCLASSAEKNNMRLIAIVFGAESEKARAWESQKLLSYGFMHFRTHLIFKANEVLETQRVWGGALKQVELGVNKDVFLTLPKGRREELKSELVLDAQLKAPLEQEQVVGVIRVTWKDKVLLEAPLLAMDAVPEGHFLRRIWDAWIYFLLKQFN